MSLKGDRNIQLPDAAGTKLPLEKCHHAHAVELLHAASFQDADLVDHTGFLVDRQP